ncbi:NAD(P)/FAD-dependent oxidoreductase [Mycoplasmopsis alligatoris]|uniref:Putative thioredoxin-disulfide reductase n=1 Tax=Mycoplasmopsis alligatoris A21JP2 TaxID=747682 RepID=D4XVF2_9BACT|nr:FAD-dependent oxidoreductase [Mycoplasmopsis alligatoris]EFF41670.1 putative thioredoxin-disulfide reductase [Mycoplasmopsis alligatoris A21JP2]
MTKQQYDLVIIGSGPAGLNAALYASRANLSVAFVEKGAPGGKLSATSKIENWLGFGNMEGWEMAQKFFGHAQEYGAKYVYGEVENIISHSEFDKEIVLKDGKTLSAKSVLIATGMKNRIPTFIKNVETFIDRGVSFCAICDGPIFGKNPTLVLGGGNSAVEESVYLSKIASHVYLVIKDAEFNAEKRLVDDLLKLDNVTIFRESQIVELQGGDMVEKALVKDKNGKITSLEIASFFPYIGLEPAAYFAQGLGVLEPTGFIKTNEEMETRVPGVYAAGDIRVKNIRQIVTAAADGAIAAKSISDHLSKQN